ncbi:MAG: Hsp20/alpha crystallin family protein [Nanoarchaeota archaeon]|nr:Hsp20/alpha crystallin family protein [Nanoarchaeota archaeon]
MTQFDEGKMEIYKNDFHRVGNYRDYGFGNEETFEGTYKSGYPGRMDYLDPTEIIESKNNMVINVPLSGFSLESLKIIPHKSYIIIESNNKRIFVSLAKKINPKAISASIKNSVLIIQAERD